MTFHKLVIAAAATLVAGAASAQVTSINLTGASATQKNLLAGLKAVCTANGGTATNVYENSSNIKTYVCVGGAFADDGSTYTVDTVRHNVVDGSLQAINAGATKQFATTTCTGGVAPNFTGCGLSAAEQTDGGLMDVNPDAVLDKITAGISYNTVEVGFSQAFGVAVSDQLYLKLYRQQRALTGVNQLIDSTCPTAADTDANIRAAYATPGCQPTVSKADITAIINADATNRFKTAGVGGFGLTSGKLTYARRVNTSGTQSSAEIYFLDAGKPGADAVIAGGTVVGTTYEALNLSGSSNVINALKCGTSGTCAANTAGDRIGILSAENVPADANTGWRYVRLNGAAIAEGYGAVNNVANAIAGRYDFVFESVGISQDARSADHQAAVEAVLTAVFSDTSASTPGLFRNVATPSGVVESRYGRGGNALAPFKRQ